MCSPSTPKSSFSLGAVSNGYTLPAIPTPKLQSDEIVIVVCERISNPDADVQKSKMGDYVVSFDRECEQFNSLLFHHYDLKEELEKCMAVAADHMVRLTRSQGSPRTFLSQEVLESLKTVEQLTQDDTLIKRPTFETIDESQKGTIKETEFFQECAKRLKAARIRVFKANEAIVNANLVLRDQLSSQLSLLNHLQALISKQTKPKKTSSFLPPIAIPPPITPPLSEPVSPVNEDSLRNPSTQLSGLQKELEQLNWKNPKAVDKAAILAIKYLNLLQKLDFSMMPTPLACHVERQLDSMVHAHLYQITHPLFARLMDLLLPLRKEIKIYEGKAPIANEKTTAFALKIAKDMIHLMKSLHWIQKSSSLKAYLPQLAAFVKETLQRQRGPGSSTVDVLVVRPFTPRFPRIGPLEPIAQTRPKNVPALVFPVVG